MTHSEPPRLTDRAALDRNRKRIDPAALFLHDLAAEELQDRLEMVNKTFPDAAIITGIPEAWQNRPGLPAVRIIPDTATLDLAPNSLDLILHVMSLHWADDPVGQLIQSLRALKPDGLFLAIFPGGQTLTELRAALGQAETETTGGLSPRVAPMAEIRDLGALLQRAGFALPVADSLPLTVSYETPLHLMRELRAMGEANALATRLRRPTRRAVITRAAELYAQAYSDDTGRVIASFELITLTGWAPDDSQPKPLRPGSATARLADALNARETPLKD
jgi:SAM-dependent methyltransferase